MTDIWCIKGREGKELKAQLSKTTEPNLDTGSEVENNLRKDKGKQYTFQISSPMQKSYL